MSLTFSQCSDCKHFDDGYTPPPGEFGARCKAFPDRAGIPEDVFSNKVMHNKVLPGQQGQYTYEQEGQK